VRAALHPFVECVFVYIKCVRVHACVYVCVCVCVCVVIVRASFCELGSNGQIEELCNWPLRRSRIIGAFRSMTGCSGARELRKDESFPDKRISPPTPAPSTRRLTRQFAENFFDQLMRSPRGTREKERRADGVWIVSSLSPQPGDYGKFR